MYQLHKLSISEERALLQRGSGIRMNHMSWITRCRRVGFGLAVAMVSTEHLGAQENNAVSPLLPTRPAATDAVHDIPLCADSAQYVHQIPVYVRDTLFADLDTAIAYFHIT